MLCLKGICAALSEADFCAIAGLDALQELVLDCEQPPELDYGAEEIKWGLQDFPEGMLHLTNMTHLTLTCHYGITELPETLSKLSKLEVKPTPCPPPHHPPPSLPMAVVMHALGPTAGTDSARGAPPPSYQHGLLQLCSTNCSALRQSRAFVLRWTGHWS